MTYTTNAAKINADKPRQLNGKNAQEIVEYMQKHYDVTIGQSGLPAEPRNKCTAFLMAVMSAVKDPSDWRNPFYARFPECGNEWVKAVAIWYHADKGYETGIGAGSHGYQAW